MTLPTQKSFRIRFRTEDQDGVDQPDELATTMTVHWYRELSRKVGPHRQDCSVFGLCDHTQIRNS